MLKVKGILVVGHSRCGGVSVVMDGRRRGLVDHWLHTVRELYREYRRAPDRIADEQARINRLCALIAQVEYVAADIFVRAAWVRSRALSVHGSIDLLVGGPVNDLEVTVRGPAEADCLS